MKYYKVVTHVFRGYPSLRGLYSCIASDKACVKYEPGKWVEAPKWLQEAGFHLFVFDTIENALAFCPGVLFTRIPTSAICRQELWECEAEDVFPAPERLADIWSLDRGEIELTDYHPPIGSLMARRVKLTKQITLASLRSSRHSDPKHNHQPPQSEAATSGEEWI